MDVRQVLQELIAIPERPEAVASVYLNTRWADEHQRDAVRVFVLENVRKALKGLPNEDARGALARTLSPVEVYVAGLLRQRHDDGATGIALFSSAPMHLFRVVATRTPFEPMEFLLERRPYVVPLVRALNAFPMVLFCTVDSEGGTLFELRGGEVDSEGRVERPFPGFHGRGGWSQRRFAQHLGTLRERNLRSVAEPLALLADANPEALLVLSGQHFLLAAFEELLPERVRERIVARLQTPASGSEGEQRQQLLREAWPHIERAVRAQRSLERDAVLVQASRGGLGVVGVAATLLALAERRAHRLLVDPGYRAQGWACQGCGALVESGSVCGYCGGALRAVAFPDEIVRRAVAADTQVVFLPPGLGLPAGTGLGAQLRHRGSAQPALGEPPALY